MGFNHDVFFSAAVSARAIQANPPADRAYGRPRRRLGPENGSYVPSQRAEPAGTGPRVTTRARPAPPTQSHSNTRGSGNPDAVPPAHHGAAGRRAGEPQPHGTDWASRPRPSPGAARTRRGPSAPALPSATRRGGRTHRYAEPRSPPEIAGLPPRGAIIGPLVQRGASGTDERGVSWPSLTGRVRRAGSRARAGNSIHPNRTERGRAGGVRGFTAARPAGRPLRPCKGESGWSCQ